MRKKEIKNADFHVKKKIKKIFFDEMMAKKKKNLF